MPVLWIASNNAKKRAELARLLTPLGWELRTPAELPSEYAPMEDRPDFAGNARVKASSLAILAQGLALGDDSGLCVDALEGRPGVHSARYGGPGLDDRGRVARLLADLSSVPPERRTAHFVCSLCLCRADGAVLLAVEERCEGTLLETPSGAGGFGYDPIFVPREYEGDPTCTFARLGAIEKDRLSHRGKALRALVRRLPEVLQPWAAGSR
jgi:XTP/dITP diphosphohydrolase